MLDFDRRHPAGTNFDEWQQKQREAEKQKAEQERQQRLNAMAAAHARVKEQEAQNIKGWERFVDWRIDLALEERRTGNRRMVARSRTLSRDPADD